MATQKTAVVMIHGLGEQRPMDTIASFVKAAWRTDDGLVDPSRAEVFFKPELVTGSFELRRITTLSGSAGKKKRVDFFEFYWAHHMQGHTVGQLMAWLSGLFIRSPASVPRSVFGVWMLGIFMLFLAGLVALAWGASYLGFNIAIPTWLAATLAPALAVGGFFLNRLILPYAGDAARYLSATPQNVAIRQKIRKEGVSLIEDITATGKYDRIVLVGHSLGSVIAYDIINFSWNRLDANKMKAAHGAGSTALAALSEVEEKGLALKAAGENDLERFREYRNAQRRYRASLNGNGAEPLWIVSDLVTVGCPLSKADVLLANDADDFTARQKQRELPMCPPAYEATQNGTAEQFSYPLGKPVRRPHHAAPFGAVVWSNIYVPHRFIIFGDVISGPLRRLFGMGVLDVKLPIGRPPKFLHTKYWALIKGQPTQAVHALRSALNLAEREEEREVWQSYEEMYGGDRPEGEK